MRACLPALLRRSYAKAQQAGVVKIPLLCNHEINSDHFFSFFIDGL